MNRLFAVVALLAVNVSTAIAQPNPLNIIIESLAYSPDIDKDLGLDDDVARNLGLLRNEYKASVEKAYQEAGFNPRDFPTKMTPAEQNTFVRIKPRLINDYRPKAAALLSPDQINRMQEIAFQIRLHDFGAKAIVEPAIASELKLTTAQIQAIESLNRERQKAGQAIEAATNLLTEEQRGILSELKGREFQSRFLTAPPGPGNRR